MGSRSTSGPGLASGCIFEADGMAASGKTLIRACGLVADQADIVIASGQAVQAALNV